MYLLTEILEKFRKFRLTRQNKPFDGAKNYQIKKNYLQVVIESKWIDNSEIKSYNPKVNWNPQLFIENLITTIKETITYSFKQDNGYSIVTEIRKTQGLKHLQFYLKFPNSL